MTVMTVAKLVEAMEHIAPPRLAEDWDNVGLLVGDLERPLDGGVLLTIDLTEPVLEEAISLAARAIVAYHPPIFRPLKSITASEPTRRVLLRAIEAGQVIYSPHTALDAAPDGLADWLADGCADGKGSQRRALTPALQGAGQSKVVVFVPAEPPDVIRRVREAISDAGGGRIGAYDLCSFMIPGTGSFRGDESTSPTVGERGRLETVSEIRMEMVCPNRALARVVEAIRRTHPYEEPAFDIYPLAGAPSAGVGAGRAITLDTPINAARLGERLRDFLGVARVRVADAGREVRRVGVCPGAGGSLLDAAVADGCDAFVTGEMRHHDVLGALERDCSVVLAGHTNTERGYLPILARRLRERLGEAAIAVSERDAWPLREV